MVEVICKLCEDIRIAEVNPAGWKRAKLEKAEKEERKEQLARVSIPTVSQGRTRADQFYADD